MSTESFCGFKGTPMRLIGGKKLPGYTSCNGITHLEIHTSYRIWIRSWAPFLVGHCPDHVHLNKQNLAKMGNKKKSQINSNGLLLSSEYLQEMVTLKWLNVDKKDQTRRQAGVLIRGVHLSIILIHAPFPHIYHFFFRK